jgi:FXSXX-COOH protein
VYSPFLQLEWITLDRRMSLRDRLPAQVRCADTTRGEQVKAGPDQVADSDVGPTLLVDVRHTPVADLMAADGIALSRSLRRVLDSLDDPNGVLSAFSSFASS